MKVLKNSSGKVLLSDNKPIKCSDNTPDTSSITIYDATTAFWLTHLDLVNNTTINYTSVDPARVISGHINDIILGKSGYLEDYTYSGVIPLGSIDTSYTGYAFKIIAASASVAIMCFVAETKITMADGTLKNIEDIQIGDKVLGYNMQNYISVNVLRTFTHDYSGQIYKVIYENGSFEATGNHPIYIDGVYKKVEDLEIGDNLFINGKNSPITNIAISRVSDIKVYNLDVDTTDNYVANGCLAHNKPT